MRRTAALAADPSTSAPPRALGKSDWHTVLALLPYLWQYKWRVGLALLCLVGAKLANVGVPVLLKQIVDGLAQTPTLAAASIPLAFIVGYGLLRISTSAFTELREFLFARVTQSAVHTIALKTFRHLHALTLRFHLNRRTGGVTREIDHGMRGISSLISYTLYSILPTLVEIGLVLGYLLWKYEIWFAAIVVCSLSAYIVFTVLVTNWRTQFRRQVNALDARAAARATDSLLNFETVKYFNNEEYEARRYDETLQQQEATAVRAQQSLNLLNTGQQLLIGIGVTLILWRAAVGVQNGTMTLGDLVLVNAFMIQLYIPLNFLGVIYREIKQSLADMERMFKLLNEHQEIQDAPGAQPLQLEGAEVKFSHVDFSYELNRKILFDVSFTIPPGQTVAVVGPSGSGKSTLSRLLFRFYDVSAGSITIDGQDLRAVTQSSLRGVIGIVPQDTVLFNDTIFYNIAYGRPDATPEEVMAAARVAHIHDFIHELPQGYDTMVGERGLKLSGGEKQRIAIARTILKNPAVLVFDEATSALDSKTEQAIQTELMQIARGRSTLMIAHRLSTIAHADRILVLEHGRIVEHGSHAELLALGGLYAQSWAIQQREQQQAGTAAEVLPR